MPYGRIDVYWPDGPIESYQLNKPTTAIGRSTGNDIVLDTTAISRYHVTFTFKDQTVFLEDLQSVNGTYVDSVRIPPNDPFPLRGGEEIQIGDIRLVFHSSADLTADFGDTTQRIILSQLTYRVEMEAPDMRVAPGAHVQAVLKIENLGDEVDRYFVELEGLPKTWVRIDRLELEVDPGDAAQVIISFKPLRRSESAPGEYPFMVRVRSRSNPAQTADAPSTLRVLPFSGFGMALVPLSSPDGRFTLYLHNQGNAPLSLALRGMDAAQQLQVHLPVTSLALGPGERQTLSGTVRPRQRRWLGSEREVDYSVAAQAQDASHFLAAVPGRFTEKSALPAWTPALIIPAVLVVALAIAGVLLLLSPDDEPPPTPAAPAPSIVSFSTAHPSITLGQIAQVSWQVTDADRVLLTVNDGDAPREIEVGPDQSPYALTFDRTGAYTLSLRATRGDLAATATTSIQVLPQVALTVEVGGAGGLVRHVESDVRLTWDVVGARAQNGAQAISVDSSDQSAPLFAAPLPPRGSEVITVAPDGTDAEWLVTLVAQGEEGVMASVTQSLRIAEPSCELRAARTVVRTGPGELYPAAVPPLEASGGNTLLLRPIGRAPDGGWLKITLGVGEDARSGWVAAADLRCTNFDPARLIVNTDFPPPPAESTPRPSATPRATPTSASAPILATPTGALGGE